MARSFSGSGQYLTTASALVAAAPMTFACWINATAVPASANLYVDIMSISSSTSAHSSAFNMEIKNNTGANPKLTAECSNDAGSVDDETAQASTVIATATWYHAACVWASATSRSAYINGAAKVSSSVSCTPGTCNSTTIAAINVNGAVSTTSEFNGQVAFPAIWKVALSDADITSLASGASPRKVQPGNLVSYSRLTGAISPEPDIARSTTWTLTGAPTTTANPRLYAP
jgi:hypothetical protein